MNKDIHSLLSDDVDLDAVLEEEERYHDHIIDTLAILKPAGENNCIPLMNNTLPVINNHNNKLKLPAVSLPEYSGDCCSLQVWKDFSMDFESILDKHPLSNYEKFLYLKGQLHKGPKALVSSLEPTEQTYESAKELRGVYMARHGAYTRTMCIWRHEMTKAFASAVTQRYDVIKRLSELKLTTSTDVIRKFHPRKFHPICNSTYLAILLYFSVKVKSSLSFPSNYIQSLV